MSKKDKSKKPKNQVKLDKSYKKEFKKEKDKLSKLEKEIKKKVKAFGKLNKEVKKEEKDLNKLQDKKEALLVAFKILEISQTKETETQITEPKTAETTPQAAPVAQKGPKKAAPKTIPGKVNEDKPL